MSRKKINKVIDEKPLSSQELKFWLKGILEFQSDGWVPNKDQWETVKNKIFNLKDEVINVQWHENKNPVYMNPRTVVQDSQNTNKSQLPENTSTLEGGNATLVANTFPNLSREEIEKSIEHYKTHGTSPSGTVFRQEKIHDKFV